MDSTKPSMEGAKTSFMDIIPSTEVEQELDTSVFGVSIVEEIISSSVTQMDEQTEQVLESTDIAETSNKASTAGNISDREDVFNILLPSKKESNTEIIKEKDYSPLEANNSFLNTIVIQDAFIFCPTLEPIVMNDTFDQGIFASEREMNNMEDDRISISNKFISIEFNEGHENRSKVQAIEEYLLDVKNNAQEYKSALNVQGILYFDEDTPVESWLLNSVDLLKGHTNDLPTNWLDIAQLINKDDWSLLFSLSLERIEAERIYIPIAAFKFWEQQDFKELLNEVMDKSAFYKFKPEEEKMQGIGYLFLEMFKIRRQINILNMQPEMASKFFNQKWSKPMTGYRIIKSMCKIKCSGIKKMLKELPMFKSNNEVTTAMNYLITALTTYKAVTEVMFYRLINVTIVCQIIKPLLQQKEFSWTHQAIFTLLRSATNIFLMKLLEEFHELKANFLIKEENIIKGIRGVTIEEKATNILNLFMFNDMSNITIPSTLFESRNVEASVEVKPRKGKKKRTNNEDDETHKIVSIVSTQEEEKQKIGCRIRMLVGHDVDGKLNATIITTKKEVDYQFWYPKRNKVINEYKHIRDYYSWDDDFETDGESAKGTYSPKVYDLRTPQKKPGVMNMMCDIFSDETVMDMNVPSKRTAKRNMIGEPLKATTPKTLVPILSSKPENTSIVDLILLEESSQAKQSEPGSVIKLKNCILT